MARKQAQNEPHPFAADLRAVDLFEDLEPRDLDVLANVARDYHYEPGDVVVAEGDQSGRFHLIVSGRATVTVGDQVVAEFGPGSYFGELAMIDRQPRSATVTAAEELHTLSLASIPLSGYGARVALQMRADRLERIYGGGLAVLGFVLLAGSLI